MGYARADRRYNGCRSSLFPIEKPPECKRGARQVCRKALDDRQDLSSQSLNLEPLQVWCSQNNLAVISSRSSTPVKMDGLCALVAVQ
jgi:hypothetical protein